MCMCVWLSCDSQEVQWWWVGGEKNEYWIQLILCSLSSAVFACRNKFRFSLIWKSWHHFFTHGYDISYSHVCACCLHLFQLSWAILSLTNFSRTFLYTDDRVIIIKNTDWTTIGRRITKHSQRAFQDARTLYIKSWEERSKWREWCMEQI